MGLLEEDEISAALQRLQWEREGDSFVKVVKKKNFAEAMSFVNIVAQMAEAANHHPDIDIRWNTVTLRLSTHSAGGITERDVELAAALDDLA